MNKETLTTKVFLLIFFILFCINIQKAWSKGGKIVFFKGDVKISLDKGLHWNFVNLHQEIPEGGCIKVGKDSEAAILLKDRSQIRLSAGSIFCIKRAGPSPRKKGRPGIYKLWKGSLWFRNKRRVKKPIFETPIITASIRGTEMAISVKDQKTTDVVVLEGIVQCKNEIGKVVIKRGQKCIALKDRAPKIVAMLHPEDAVQWLLITPNIVGPKDKYVKGKALKAVKTSQKAMEFLVRDKYKEALKIAKKAILIDDTRASVHVALATVLQRYGKFELALKEAMKARVQDPYSLPALLRATELLLGLDRIQEAEKQVDEFKGNTKDPRYLMLKGFLYLVKYEGNKAKKLFESAIKLRSDLSYCYLGLGLSLYYLGEIKKGLENMEKACLLEPLAAAPHYYLGKALYNIGERKEAEIEIKRAIEVDPKDPTPYIYLATIFSDHYRAGEGIYALQQAIKLNNNRLITRSRFLLDQDRAIKNITLARSLTDMGLYSWAKHIGDLAVWDDPTNSGAYLFRAAHNFVIQDVGASTYGDTIRARLLQPVNGNTFTTYTEYQNLLELPTTKGSIGVKIGTDDSFDSYGYVYGGKNKVALYAEPKYTTTDGPKDGSGRWEEKLLFRVKGALSYKHYLYFQSLIGHRHEEDLDVWQMGDIEPKDKVSRGDHWSFLGGYHWRQSAGRSLLVSAQISGLDVEKVQRERRILDLNSAGLGEIEAKSINKIKSYRFPIRLEAVQFFRFNNHRISGGMAWQDSYLSDFYNYYRDIYELSWLNYSNSWIAKDHTRELRTYLRDIWYLNDQNIVDVGVAYCALDGMWRRKDGSQFDRKELLPHIGFINHFTSKDTLRIAYFQELQPNYLSGTLQPIEVAGFQRVTGVTPGTWTWFYGVGWDRQWNNSLFTQIELTRVHRKYPDKFIPTPAYFSSLKKSVPWPYRNLGWKEDITKSLKFAIEGLVTKNLAIGITDYIREVKVKNISLRRLDYDLRARITFMHSSGVKIRGIVWYLDQKEDKNFERAVGDNFTILSLSFEKSLFDKKALLFMKWENITNEKFRCVLYKEADANQIPWQGSIFKLGFQVNF